MLTRIYARALLSLESRLIEIVCDMTSCLPGFIVVGLGDKVVDEAHERVRSRSVALSESSLDLDEVVDGRADASVGEDIPQSKLEDNESSAKPGDAAQVDANVAIIPLVARASRASRNDSLGSARYGRCRGSCVLKLVLAIRLGRLLLCH